MVTVYVSITDIASYNLSINNLFTNCLTICGNKKARQLGSVALKEGHGGSLWCGVHFFTLEVPFLINTNRISLFVGFFDFSSVDDMLCRRDSEIVFNQVITCTKQTVYTTVFIFQFIPCASSFLLSFSSHFVLIIFSK